MIWQERSPMNDLIYSLWYGSRMLLESLSLNPDGGLLWIKVYDE
jgi:hypothetical protein